MQTRKENTAQRKYGSLKPKYYLAYGSNLNVEQMKRRCPTAEPIGTATLDGYRLCFCGSKTGSYLNVEPAPGESVPVGIWKIYDQDEINLDWYEGYPTFYKKFEIFVKPTGRKRRIRAMIYAMPAGAKYGIPTKSYTHTCMQGYTDFGMDQIALQDALLYSAHYLGGRSGYAV